MGKVFEQAEDVADDAETVVEAETELLLDEDIESDFVFVFQNRIINNLLNIRPHIHLYKLFICRVRVDSIREKNINQIVFRIYPCACPCKSLVTEGFG